MAVRAQAILDIEIVLENAVVHDDQGAGAVGVGVRVVFRGTPVRGPPRMTDADGAVDGAVAQRALERLDPTHGAPDVQAARVEHGNARRIIAAVLQPLEAVDDDADRALLTHIADDAAHGCSPPIESGGERAALLPQAPPRLLPGARGGGSPRIL